MQDREDHHWLKQGSTASGEVAKTYDDWAASYDVTLADWDYRAPKQAADLLAARMPPASAVLDAGCGTGLVGAALRAAGFTGPIDGLDISPSSLQEAEKSGIYRSLDTANLQAPPLDIPNNTYNALVCIGVLTYVPDTEGVLREFTRLVRSGGVIVISQRDDLFMERGFADAVQGLASAGLLTDFAISEPQPYLPDNPDFGAAIGVIYVTMVVA
ncbi:MAG: class I SAM-dependent methyltransferase [Alphaproteobacteria bacterium]|nr:class I SAM-dependent methyltransferase [Alphaproteobacteria bacterium]